MSPPGLIISGDRYGSQRGIALIVTLWLLVILIVMVFSFSLSVRTESLAAYTNKERIENKFLAEAGIERAIMEIFYRSFYKNQNVILDNSGVWEADGTVYREQLEDGYYRTSIINESGKLDINSLSDMSGIILNNLLVNLGILKENADTIVDSILDWKDEDDLHRLNGAENEYYEALPKPYKAKNGPFDSVEELILVRGVTRDILYGSKERHGLVEFLTVHSKTGKINLKYAPKELLMAVPGMTDDTVEDIMNERKLKLSGSISIDHINLNEMNSLTKQYIGTDESNVFTIDSSGYKNKEKHRYSIRATVAINSSKMYRYLYYKSPVYSQ